jgi:formyltetrahydrofolate deformylase
MSADLRHVLLMDGPDSTGLIHCVTGVLARQKLNIFRNDEFVSPDGQFFMRTEFEGQYEPAALLNELTQTLPTGISLRLNPRKKKNIVVFVTKEHHCLAELLIRYAFNELDADILAVVSNYNHLNHWWASSVFRFIISRTKIKVVKNTKTRSCAP